MENRLKITLSMNKIYKWEFFIAHASQDKNLAEELYDQLANDSRVFLDSRSLMLGDDWDIELRKAQRESFITIILISSNTDISYYQREEIAAAISLARTGGGHRVIPVYLDREAANSDLIPYGLRLKHGITLSGSIGVPQLRKNLLSLLRQLQKADEHREGVQSDRPNPDFATTTSFENNKEIHKSKMPSSKVVITLHGIKTRGNWQKDLDPILADAGFVPVPLDYGYFLALQLLLPGSRRKKIDWLRDEYQRVCIERKVDRPSIIAHSFGTYLVARAIQIYDTVLFDRIILCGAIVNDKYHWKDRFDKDKVRAVLNDFGRMDFWAGIVAWVVNDAGDSGRKGFSDLADGRVIEIDHPEFRHGDYFFRGNYEKSWIPFLRGESQKIVQMTEITPFNWRFAITKAVIVILLLLTILISLISFKTYIKPNGIDFKLVYDNLCSENQSDLTAFAPILKNINKNISWKGEITQTASGGGYVYTFRIKPIGGIPDTRDCKRVIIKPKNPIDLTFFGSHPEGLKVRIEGRFATFDANGVTIEDAVVSKE